MKENKKKLRKEYRRRRDAFVGQLDVASRNLSFRRLPSPLARLFKPGQTVAFYRSVGSEAPTERLIELLDRVREQALLNSADGDRRQYCFSSRNG